MLKTGQSSRILVIDASIAVWAVLPSLQDAGVDAFGRVVEWHTQDLQLVAPAMWLAEATSAIRRSIFTKHVSVQAGQTAVEDLFALRIATIDIDEALCKSALAWASRLSQSKAYDALYLALTQRLGVEFWTADKHLVAATQVAKLSWVHWIGES